jgi:hypothetical protein
MQKWKISLLAAVLAANCLAQTAADLVAPQVSRVADKLKCSCGCNLTMACFMPPAGQCGTCRIGKEKIIALQSQGKSDQQILDQFVQDNGKDVLAITPGVVGFVTPYAALAVGLGIVAFVIRRFRQPQTATLPQVDPATIERIEKDLAKLD